MSDKNKEIDSTTAPLNRDQMRAKIFGAKPKSEIVEDFFGVRLELRQPSLGIALDARGGNIEEAAIQMLLNFAYVPGSDEKVFEEADEDGIRGLPMSPDLQRVFNACNKLLGVDLGGLETQIKDAMKSASSGASTDADPDGGVGAGEESK